MKRDNEKNYKKEKTIISLTRSSSNSCLFGWTPSQRKESGYPISDFASFPEIEQTFLLP